MDDLMTLYLRALTVILLVVASNGVIVGHRDREACNEAYSSCRFKFSSKADLPIISFRNKWDVSLSPKIISKTTTELIGIVHMGNFEAHLISNNGNQAISSLNVLRGNKPDQKVPAQAIKPFYNQEVKGSGLGFQRINYWQRKVLRNHCFRIYFSSYQLVNSDGNVVANFNDLERSDNACVVFWVL